MGSARLRLVKSVGWLAGFVLLAGCGSGKKLQTYDVTGTVMFPNGKPVAGGIVTFRSYDQKVSASGIIEEDGTCRMGTFQPGDGAVAGRHGVAIAAPAIQRDDSDPPGGSEVRIARKFSSPGTSGLEFTVTPGQSNAFTFQVTPP
jgi:hypothetical protein